MMMVPYMFHDSLLDDWFNSDWDREFDRAVNAMAPRGDFGKRGAQVMKTDVRETADGYDVFVELPGFKKEDVKLDLKDGYLTISARRSGARGEKTGKAATSGRSATPAAARAASMWARSSSPRM